MVYVFDRSMTMTHEHDYLFNWHCLTYLPMLLVKDGSIRHGVTQGPEGAVAAAVVVLEKGFNLSAHQRNYNLRPDLVEEFPIDVDGHGLPRLEPRRRCDVVSCGLRYDLQFNSLIHIIMIEVVQAK